MKLFHVETLKRDQTWGIFTINPIEGEEAAQKHLEEVRAFAVKYGNKPEHARLHELTVEEQKVELVTKNRALFDAFLLRLPLGVLERIVRHKGRLR